MNRQPLSSDASVTLALGGDVMTGRGLDQILPHPGDPTIYEPFIRNASDYVTLAEQVHGPISRPVAFAYPWGDLLSWLDQEAPTVRLINLETAVTTSATPWPDKGITYRMHPHNVPCLTEAKIDCCTLANNHVLDWGYAGLLETIQHLRRAGIQTAGAGQDRTEAARPAILKVAGQGRILVFAWGLPSSGIPPIWAATDERPGVNLLEDLTLEHLERITSQIQAVRQPGDLVVVSLHWGGNWGYTIPPAHRAFARQLIATAGVDLVYGHSSHHPLGMEVYQGRLILYGCGDLINDYEGIGGYEVYRPELGILVIATLDWADGRLVRGRLLPLRRRQFRLWRAASDESRWLAQRLSRVSRPFGVTVELQPDGTLELRW